MTTPFHPELRSRALHGLSCEWQVARDGLPDAIRAGLRVPGFELRDLNSAWGLWLRGERTIVLSTRLLDGFGWLSVREVLLHEMAHQVADECFGGDDTPHGPRFLEACRLLRADPKASADAASVHQRVASAAGAGEDRILGRVRKLLAMAHGGGSHEAELAMAKVHEHMAKYNVGLLAGGASPDFLSMTLGEPVVRFAAEEYAILNLLRDFYFVHTVIIPAYVIASERMGRVAEASGRVENLKMAGYVYDFLKRTVDEQWAAFDGRRRGARRRKTDFAVGLIRGFREKLERQEPACRHATGLTQALAVRAGRDVERYLRSRYPYLRSISRRGRSVDAEAHAAGVEAGRRTVLSRPVESGVARRGLALGGLRREA